MNTSTKSELIISGAGVNLMGIISLWAAYGYPAAFLAALASLGVLILCVGLAEPSADSNNLPATVNNNCH